MPFLAVRTRDLTWYCFLLLMCCPVMLSGQISLPVAPRQDDAVRIFQPDGHALIYYDGKGLGLMDNSGTRVCNAVYFGIYALGEGFYSVQDKEGGDYALLNAQGRQLTPYAYKTISPFSLGFARVSQVRTDESTGITAEKYAIIEGTGRLISGWYDQLSAIAGDGWWMGRNGSRWSKVNEQETLALQTGHRDLGAFSAGLAPAKNPENNWGYIDAEEKWVIIPIYRFADRFQGKFARVQVYNGQWGLIDRKGQWILAPEYDSVQLFNGGAYGIAVKDQQYRYLNFAGQFLNRIVYDSLGIFPGEGLALVKKDGQYQYLDLEGEKVYTADQGKDFGYGLAAVRKGDKWGFIDESGNEVIPPAYEAVSDFTDRYALVAQGGKTFLVDRQGKVVQEIQRGIAETVLTDKAVLYLLSGRFYLVDLLKNQSFQLPYDEVGDISSGRIAVRKGPYYGFADAYGKEVVAPENQVVSKATNGYYALQKTAGQAALVYDTTGKVSFTLGDGLYFIGPYAEGLAKVVDNQSRMGFVDTKGNLVVECRYKLLGDYKNGMAIFQAMNGRFGFLNAKGAEVIPATYSWVSDFDRSGHAACVKDELFGFINQQGTVVVPFQYTNVYSLSDGIAAVQKDGKVGYINMLQKTVIPFTFDEAYQHVEDKALVRMQSYWGYINPKGKVVIPWQYVQAQAFSEGLAWVKLGDKYGAINTAGQYIIPLKYDNATPFNNGYAVVQSGEKLGLITSFGQLKIDTVCEAISPVENHKVVISLPSKGYGIFPLK